MPKITNLQSILEQASKKYDVPFTLLEKILEKERTRLYVIDFSMWRPSTIDDIRAMIQEEIQKRK